MKDLYDVIIVGSGPAGVHSAYPLVEAGLNVALVDASGSNQTLKTKSNIKIVQSFEKGGLSNVWPGICDYFSDQELKEVGLPIDEIIKEYNEIEKRIKLQKQSKLDPQIKSLLNKNTYQLPVAPYYKTAPIIDEFKMKKNFTYIPKFPVLSVNEHKDLVEIYSGSTVLTGKYVILATGAINTTRIISQSFNIKTKIPFLTKGYNLFICVNTKMLLKKHTKDGNLLGQIATSSGDYFIQFYPFNKNSLSKIALPLPERFTSQIFSRLGPLLVIADVRFNKKINSASFYKLRGDFMEIKFKYTNEELRNHKKSLLQIRRNLLSMGLLPLKTIRGEVTSHYAGGANVPGKLSVDVKGRMEKYKRIYVADASTWHMLPGKPPTLTIMANASRIGKNVLKNFV